MPLAFPAPRKFLVLVVPVVLLALALVALIAPPDARAADPAIRASAKGQTAERECKARLSSADNYLKIDQPDKAKTYLRRIVDKYGDTEWAAEAKKRLATLR